MERITPIFVLGNKDLKRADCSLENWRVQIEYGDNLGELMNDDISITLDILIRSCLHLLDVMGVQVIRVPDNATAYCAHLNERGVSIDYFRVICYDLSTTPSLLFIIAR